MNHLDNRIRTGGRLAPQGFTIIEVLVVILLISLLAVFMVPRYLDRVEGAKHKTAKSQIALLEQNLSAFYMDCSSYPSELSALRTAPANLSGKWHGPYGKESDFVDPWGNPFKYIFPGTKNPSSFDIVCYGSDGQPGGEGYAADITND
jgi:general secretion pathway protein G